MATRASHLHVCSQGFLGVKLLAALGTEYVCVAWVTRFHVALQFFA